MITTAALAVMALPALAATIVVDGQGGGDYRLIQEAIDHAQSGDTILVMPGNYIEDLLVHKPLTIVSHAGPRSTFVFPSSSVPGSGTDPQLDSATHLMRVTASNVSIEGFTLEGENPLLPNNPDARTGVITDSRAGPVNDLKVASCVIRDVQFRGVHLSGPGAATISSNTFANIAFEADASGGLSTEGVALTCTSNVFDDCLFGILLSGGGGDLNSNVVNGGAMAVQVTGNTAPTSLTSNRVTACTVGFLCARNGAAVKLDRSTAVGCDQAIMLQGKVAAGVTVEVVGSNIDGLSSAVSVGIATNTRLPSGEHGDVRAVLRQNAIRNTANAVVLAEFDPTAAVTEVVLSGREGDTNHFHSTSGQMLLLVGTDDPVDARFNYWGTTDPAAIELRITHHLDDLSLGYVDASHARNGEPLLRLTGGTKLGDLVDLELSGLYTETFILMASLSSAAIPLPPFGVLLLDPTFLFTVATGGLPPSGVILLETRIPDNPNLVGSSIYLQTLTGLDLPAGVGSLSNAVVLSVEIDETSARGTQRFRGN